MTGIHLPKLSEYDSVTSAEGALDPLGLYAIAVSRKTTRDSAMRPISSSLPGSGKGDLRLPPAIASMLSLSAVNLAIRLKKGFLHYKENIESLLNKGNP